MDLFKLYFIASLTLSSLNVSAIDTESTGHKLLPNQSRTINAHGTCNTIWNSGTEDEFIATKTATEWNSFLTNYTGNIKKGPCVSTCSTLKAMGVTSSGVYTLDIDGTGTTPAMDLYCDMTTDGGGWTLVAYSNGTATATLPNDFMVNTYNSALIGAHSTANTYASVDPENFSTSTGTTDTMFISPSYNSGSAYIDLAGGSWDYDNAKCTGILRHTGRTAGCPGQSANDNYDSADAFNIAVESGNQAIVPAYKASEVCYNGKGSCSFKFFLR